MKQTLVITNFHGSMTPYINGDINSGKGYSVEIFGHDPFTKPGNLTWNDESVQIDAAGSVITDMILAGKVRVESGITYVYAIGHTGRLYKIQVNDPTTYNPNYDNPVLLATLSVNTPTFTRGGFLEFFGATERMYIGHDKGLTRIDFSGANETFVGVLGSWTQDVPRPLQKFLGKLYIGNGTNIAELDENITLTTYTKLSPGFPTSSQVRDLDVTPDGNYLIQTVAEQALGDITSTATPTQLIATDDSYVFKWNGTDAGYTSFITYPGVTLSANFMFNDSQYMFGYDILGGGVYNPIRKMFTSYPASSFVEPPSPNGVVSIGNTAYWITPLWFDGFTEALITAYGTISDYEIEPGYFAPFDQPATGTETDIIRTPFMLNVSAFAQGSSTNGYTDNIFGVPKIYFSTLETSSTPTTKYKLHKWSPLPTGLGTPISGGKYQTQTQLFSKKMLINEVRVYAEPWVADNAFTVSLINSADTVITGSSKTFTAGSNLTVGDDFAWYNPDCAPTYSIGLRITNEGTTNFTIKKVEIDISDGGK